MTRFDAWQAKEPGLYAALLEACGGDRRRAEQLFDEAFTDGHAQAVNTVVLRERRRCADLYRFGMASGDCDLVRQQITNDVSVEDAYLQHLAVAGSEANRVNLTWRCIQLVRRSDAAGVPAA